MSDRGKIEQSRVVTIVPATPGSIQQSSPEPPQAVRDLKGFPTIDSDIGWWKIHDPRSSTTLLLCLAYKALAVIYVELYTAIISDRIDRRIYKYLGTPMLPMPPTRFTIPFTSFMTLPLPFSLHCAQVFSTCHLSIETTPEFIENGEWVEYGMDLNFRFGGPSTYFQAPNQGIQFSVTMDKVDSNILYIRSNDGHRDLIGGLFHFEGQLWKDSGKINLAKHYHGDYPHDTYYQALLTPFGIVGYLGTNDHSSCGWIWLWKTEWCSGSFIDW